MSQQESLPSAQYKTADGVQKQFTLSEVDKKQLSSNGTTTGPSPYLIECTNGTYEDRDMPSELNLSSPMGVLRGHVTRLQDEINVYLTERIKTANGGLEEREIEEDLEQEVGEDIEDEMDA